jgi:hypothetical protein
LIGKIVNLRENKMKKEKKNTIGIIGFIFSFLSPIVGLILGIISLAKEERTPAWGISAIVISVLNFLISLAILGALL